MRMLAEDARGGNAIIGRVTKINKELGMALPQLHMGRHEGEGAKSARATRPQASGTRALPGFDNENIRYMDAGALSRPLDPTREVRLGMAAAMVAAAVIGGVLLFNYFDGVVNAPAREQAALEENMAREVSLDLPGIASLMSLDDAGIMSVVQASGGEIYERVPVGTSADGSFEVIKLPEGVSVADAGAIYLAGIDSVSPSEAVRVLNGAWDMKVSRTSGTDINIHFADFSSGSVQEAVQNAIVAAGLEQAALVDSGVDDSGNTYASGTVEADGAAYNWQVSGIALSEIYRIDGVSEDAAYVGVRFTQA